MKYYILSDLHNEFGVFPVPDDVPEYDAVILAGDIDLGTNGLLWAARTFDKPVFYVAGNHEFYGGQQYEIVLEELEKLDTFHVYFLDNTYINEYKIFGATLWTDFDNDPHKEMIIGRSLNDYMGQIKNSKRNLSTYDTKNAHEDTKNMLALCCANIVITHHAPSYNSVNVERYGPKTDTMHAGYCSNMDDFVLELSPKLWVHGHTHASADYMIGDTRVICNPRGYVGYEENPEFNPRLVVEI